MTNIVSLNITEKDLSNPFPINARELHRNLEVKTKFTEWIKERIRQYKFVRNVDFTSFSEISEKPKGGRPAQEYYLSIDMAKELCMVENNEKGRMIRRQLIRIEQRYREIVKEQMALQDDEYLMAKALTIADRKIKTLEKTVKELKPKADIYDKLMAQDSCVTISQFAKTIGVGPRKFFRKLKEHGILMANNLPYQKHIDAGRFKVIEKVIKMGNKGEKIYCQPVITPKGQDYLVRLFDMVAEAEKIEIARVKK